ncbi:MULTISPECIES: MbtH family protein [Streptomyces]|uniref:MbtH family protein n=1 Tax=Streptomyces TaxID=1883 RepID=UPI0004C853AF|nr:MULTISPECIES: MbtH family NRPS accessory protein [Streptomyces]NDZ65028.1 MbtH family NRPS accessory protein [Streptomyces cyaneofuscatus]ONI49023.1 MbtH-like protein [Streptomyces sp. IB2014 011-1]RDV47049.1 antibiotic synthesis protein MbtH [Streptomyces sp. IB2014 011-12]CAD5918091.1 MbtH-like protein [Streptomyces sp. KY70]CAD5992239.1 MbtH-like protein [Streptomyces sp. KY75]
MSDHTESLYRVVLNDEEQYSIWQAERELPAGWRAEGTQGSKEECLDHIGRVWTDMRPASLRHRMESEAAEAATGRAGCQSLPV